MRAARGRAKEERMNRIARMLVVASLLTVAARTEVPTGAPEFSDPTDIDNRYNPFVPFRIKVYELVKGKGSKFAIDVFRGGTRTIPIGGEDVECAILEEWAIEDGEVVEISENYFAQADDGTVYYCGEIVNHFEGGELTGHGGSWIVGGPTGSDPDETATAAGPAVIMPAHPEVGDEWKSEDIPDAGIEEFNTAVAFHNTLRVPEGRFRNVLQVRGETPAVENKWYAPRIGFIQSKETGETVALVELEDNDDDEEMEEELEEILEDILGEDEEEDDDD
jgi:hypothetical protein